MTITINRNQFAKQFSAAAEAVPSRTQRDVLKNVLLVSTGTTIELSASDGEQHIKSVISYEGDQERCLIPAARMKQVLNELSEEALTISIRDTELTIKSGSAVFKLQTGDPIDFPEVPTFKSDSFIEVDSATLKDMIRKTIFCVDTDSTRYALGGVQLEIIGETITMAATDTRRLTVINGKCSQVNNPKSMTEKPVIPAAAMKLVASSLDNAASVKIAVNQNDIAFQIGEVSIASQLVQGRFPGYRKVCPEEKSFTRRISLPVGQFARLLSAARVMESPESKGLHLRFEKGILAVNATTSSIGDANAEMPISFDGEPIKIYVCGQYLSEMCKAFQPDQSLDVGIIASDARISFAADGVKHIVMPLSKDDADTEAAKKPKKEKA